MIKTWGVRGARGANFLILSRACTPAPLHPTLGKPISENLYIKCLKKGV